MPTSTRATADPLLTPGSNAAPSAPASRFRFAVRPAQSADAKALALVHGRAIRALAGDARYARDELEAWASRMRPENYLDATPERIRIVAQVATGQGPRVIGYGQLHLGEGTIEAVYVDPDFARRGVGTALVGALEGECRARGLAGLLVEASLNSVPFYEALGFVAKGLDHHPLAPGVGIACEVMEKRLTPATPARE